MLSVLLKRLFKINIGMQFKRNIQYYFGKIGLRFGFASFIFFERLLSDIDCSFFVNNISIKRINVDDLERSHVIGFLSFEEANEKILLPGCYFFVAFKGECVLGSCWLMTGSVNLNFMDHEDELCAGIGYIAHVIVNSKARRQGVAAALINYAISVGENIGLRKLIVCCDARNSAIRRIMFKISFKQYLVVDYSRLLFLNLYWCKWFYGDKMMRKDLQIGSLTFSPLRGFCR